MQIQRWWRQRLERCSHKPRTLQDCQVRRKKFLSTLLGSLAGCGSWTDKDEQERRTHVWLNFCLYKGVFTREYRPEVVKTGRFCTLETKKQVNLWRTGKTKGFGFGVGSGEITRKRWGEQTLFRFRDPQFPAPGDKKAPPFLLVQGGHLSDGNCFLLFQGRRTRSGRSFCFCLRYSACWGTVFWGIVSWAPSIGRPQKLGEGQGEGFLHCQASRRDQPCQHFDFRLLGSKTERK